MGVGEVMEIVGGGVGWGGAWGVGGREAFSFSPVQRKSKV